MDHLRKQWAKLAWRESDTIRGYPLPVGGQFGHTKAFLDPDIFDKREVMHPWIRNPIIDMIGAFWAPKYGNNWKDWTRIYLAGSLASYWWYNLDFDTLIGVNTKVFEREHPQFAGMSDAETCKYLTDEFRQTLDVYTANYSFPPAPDTNHILTMLGAQTKDFSVPPGTDAVGPVGMTWYVNAASWDIRQIKPYAAYEIISNTWFVHPLKMDKAWGAHALTHAFWEHMADVADEVKRVVSIPNTQERQTAAIALYNKIHAERSEAFNALGGGITDRRSLQWIVLNRWGLLYALEKAAHPERPSDHIPPALASK